MIDKCMTPPQLATWLGVNRDKVLTLIRSGKLRAKNLASEGSKRPRFVISPDAIDEFMKSDQTKRPPRKTRRGRDMSGVPDVASTWLSQKATSAPSG